MFADRRDAGRQLGEALAHYRKANPVVYGLPRGGVVIAAEVARALGCELDVLLVKKLRAPRNPELAIGAICEEGRTYLNLEIQSRTGADENYLYLETAECLAEMAAQRKLYRTVRPRISATGRTVILVDDGLATGATMMAAAQVVAAAKPVRLVVAVPVSPTETLGVLEKLPGVDTVVCLLMPDWFQSVGQFYDDFTQVEDEDVVEILKGAQQ